jgi:hypothetical protein
MCGEYTRIGGHMGGHAGVQERVAAAVLSWSRRTLKDTEGDQRLRPRGEEGDVVLGAGARRRLQRHGMGRCGAGV